MKTLTIGKMAKLNGISEQTLRLYDKMGLVVPCEINKSTGYRKDFMSRICPHFRSICRD